MRIVVCSCSDGDCLGKLGLFDWILKAPKEVVVTDCVDKEGTQESGTGGWDGGGGVGKSFEKYHVGGGFVSTVNEAASPTCVHIEGEATGKAYPV
ncbi:hypothetical protein Tco_1030075 [Tanacetum coccineum]|uniref:Uncharacterized protein n=1 Tax=Tanacetum coccineum TaxID=301880 RepID=A0ABQ5G6Y0_9ASTR